MFHDMSAVATALPGESIWKGINRAAFERTAFALKEHAPEPRDYTKLERSATCCGATLPLEVEQRLASDFAFLAATSSRPSAVAAATIECSSSGLMTVRLAANEGIEDGDFRAMEEVANILRFYAVRGGLPTFQGIQIADFQITQTSSMASVVRSYSIP
jgi:hypothetical protein